MTNRSKTSRVITWRSITLQVDETHDYLWAGQTHLEINVIRPTNALIPITATGYRSHFIATEELSLAGGAVAFVVAWLDREAKSVEWQRRDFATRQLDLFAKP